MEEDEEKSHDSADYHGSRVSEVFYEQKKQRGRDGGSRPGSGSQNIDLRGSAGIPCVGSAGRLPVWRGDILPRCMSGEPGRTVEFTVEEDDGASRIADELKEEGLIQNRLIFLIQSRLFEIEFLPGTYELSTAMNSREILGVLSGDVQEMEEEET